MTWDEGTDFTQLTRASKFEAGHNYIAQVNIQVKDGYTIDSGNGWGTPETVKINGKNVPDGDDWNDSPGLVTDVDGNEYTADFQFIKTFETKADGQPHVHEFDETSNAHRARPDNVYLRDLRVQLYARDVSRRCHTDGY